MFPSFSRTEFPQRRISVRRSMNCFPNAFPARNWKVCGSRRHPTMSLNLRERNSMAQPAVVRKSRAVSGLDDFTAQEMYAELIARLGEDPTRDGLVKTPERMEKAMAFLTKGYKDDPRSILRGALFDVAYDEMVIVKEIEMFSLCEHHPLPFFGKVHVAYIP